MDSDEDFVSNMSSDDDLMQDDTDNELSAGDEGTFYHFHIPGPLPIDRPCTILISLNHDSVPKYKENH